MNKKGFTLIELLAVILIIAVLSIMAGTAVFSIIKSSRDKLLIEQENSLKDAAITYQLNTKTYMSSCLNKETFENMTSYTNCNSASLTCACEVSVQELITKGLFENKNNICKTSGYVVIYKLNGNLFSKIIETEENKVCSYE